MKKLFLVLAVSAFFVACNNDGASTTPEATPEVNATPAPAAGDSATTATPDSLKTVATPDSVK